jgi:hypothetical protein
MLIPARLIVILAALTLFARVAYAGSPGCGSVHTGASLSIDQLGDSLGSGDGAWVGVPATAAASVYVASADSCPITGGTMTLSAGDLMSIVPIPLLAFGDPLWETVLTFTVGDQPVLVSADAIYFVNSQPQHDHTSITLQPTSRADLTHDIAVDTADLVTILADWGVVDPASDINGSGAVEVIDLLSLLSE